MKLDLDNPTRLTGPARSHRPPATPPATAASGTTRPVASMRLDSGNSQTPVNPYVARIDELRRQALEETRLTGVPEVSGSPRMTGLFITVFAFGLAMSNSAALFGHYAAWLAGLVFAVVGITASLTSLLWQIHVQKQTILQLATEPKHVVGQEPAHRVRHPHMDLAGPAAVRKTESRKASA